MSKMKKKPSEMPDFVTIRLGAPFNCEAVVPKGTVVGLDVLFREHKLRELALTVTPRGVVLKGKH